MRGLKHQWFSSPPLWYLPHLTQLETSVFSTSLYNKPALNNKFFSGKFFLAVKAGMLDPETAGKQGFIYSLRTFWHQVY